MKMFIIQILNAALSVNIFHISHSWLMYNTRYFLLTIFKLYGHETVSPIVQTHNNMNFKCYKTNPHLVNRKRKKKKKRLHPSVGRNRGICDIATYKLFKAPCQVQCLLVIMDFRFIPETGPD